jgi:hypothetical protein
MFFSTHENIEHLALIEKVCGPTPLWMARDAQNHKEIFDIKRS